MKAFIERIKRFFRRQKTPVVLSQTMGGRVLMPDTEDYYLGEQIDGRMRMWGR